MTAHTTKLTVRLPTKDIEFAKRYAKEHGLTVTEVIDRYLRRMRALEEGAESSALDAITGLLPENMDVDEERLQHLKDKHLQ